jgi:hypothetical protein
MSSLRRTSFIAAIAILALTVAQLAFGALSGAQQFEGKAFGARLVFYPLLMLALPAIWAAVRTRAKSIGPIPWNAAALVMWGFLVDVTGNTLDLYDSIAWWDDANHFANWVTLTLGLGIIIARAASVAPRWLICLSTVGVGCLLALAWEAGEWYTFIRHGTELDTAYEDTLGDMLLGTLGACVAAGILARLTSRPRD